MYFTDDKPVTLDRSFDSSFTKTQHLKDFYEERLSSISKQLQVFFSELGADEIFRAMQENSLSREFAIQRASELFTEVMKSEQEATIHKQQSEISDLRNLNLKLEYENKKLSSVRSEYEERIRKVEGDRERVIHELKIANSRLEDAGFEIEEKGKRKDLEWMQKFEIGMRKLEERLQDSEQRYVMTRKELESVNGAKKSAEILAAEVENLKKVIKNKENGYFRELESVRSEYEAKVGELERSCESISSQFRGYQKQSEDLAANQQSVIKNLVDKSKQLKQKIISQKSRIQDFSKHSKESSLNFDATKSNYEKIINDLEDRIKIMQKDLPARESELVQKHQSQITQLQSHYQQMMDTKLSEMQREVDLHIRKSQDHDREVKNLMDLKMREIERDYVSKAVHERVLLEKENFLVQKFSEKIEGLQRDSEAIQSDMQKIIDEHVRQNEELLEKMQKLQDELLREKERLGADLNSKVLKLKDYEAGKNQLARDLERTQKQLRELQENYEEEAQNRIKADKELISLQNNLTAAKSDLSQYKQNLFLAKTQHEQILSEKVDKTEYFQLSDKIEVYKKDLEKKTNFINSLQDEVKSLESSLRDLKLQKGTEGKQFELEMKRHSETRTQLKELQSYSENLLLELDYRDKQVLELQSNNDTLKDEIRAVTRELQDKDQELFSFKQTTLSKQSDSRSKLRGSLEKLKKYVKTTTFFLKKQLASLTELVEHEYSSLSKYSSTLIQEISIKIIELELKYRKQTDFKAEQYGEDIKTYYRERISQVEEFISQENMHWNDPETEGIRRAVKSIIEKKHIGQIEIKSLRESVSKLTEQNEGLYRENQKLQIRLHANNEAFDQLQREVTEEANKIKLRLETGKDRSFNRG